MASPGGRKRTEHFIENPDDHNALLEFPNLNPYDSFLQFEDERETKKKKKEKSRKRKREKGKKSSKKVRRHKKTRKSSLCEETDSVSSQEEVSPWPAEFRRGTRRQCEDSDDGERRTHAVGNEQSAGDTQGTSGHSPGTEAGDENATKSSSWEENEPSVSEKEISPRPVEVSQAADSNSESRNFLHEQSSGAERSDSGRYSSPGKTGVASQRVATPYMHESHSSDAGQEARGPQASDASNEPRYDRSASMPVQSDNSRSGEPLHQISPDHKFPTGHSSNAAANENSPTQVARPGSEFTSVSHQAGCSRDFYGTVVSNMTEYSGGRGGQSYTKYIGRRVEQARLARLDVGDFSVVKQYIIPTRGRSNDSFFKDSQADDHSKGVGAILTASPPDNSGVAPCSNSCYETQTAVDIERISSHQPLISPVYDYASNSRISSEEPQTSAQGGLVASYLSETLNMATDSRPSVRIQSSLQNEDAQDTIPMQHTASPRPSTSAAEDQTGLSQDVGSGNSLCDIIIRSVPITFRGSISAKAQNEPQRHPSGRAAIHIDSSEAQLSGSLVITINSSDAANIQDETVKKTPGGEINMWSPSIEATADILQNIEDGNAPRTPGRDIELCSPSNEATANIRRSRRFRFLSRQKQRKGNECSADDELEDEASDDNK